MDKQIKTILEKCLVLMKKGYSLRYCLSKYNEHRKELEGYLRDVVNLKKIMPVKLEKDYLENNLNKIYDKIGNESVEQNSSIQYKKPLVLRPAIIFLSVFFVILFSFSGVIYASQDSIPGNSLYVIKRGIEDIKLIMYPEFVRGPLHYKILRSRIYETTLLLKNDNSNNSIINSLIEEIDLVFIQCKQYSHFGNKTEDEILNIIQLIKIEQEQRLGEDEDGSEPDLEEIFEEEYNPGPDDQDGGPDKGLTETETEYPDTEENNLEIYDDGEDIQPEINNDSDTGTDTEEEGDDPEESDDAEDDGSDPEEESDDPEESDGSEEESDDPEESDGSEEDSGDPEEDGDDPEESDDAEDDGDGPEDD